MDGGVGAGVGVGSAVGTTTSVDVVVAAEESVVRTVVSAPGTSTLSDPPVQAAPASASRATNAVSVVWCVM